MYHFISGYTEKSSWYWKWNHEQNWLFSLFRRSFFWPLHSSLRHLVWRKRWKIMNNVWLINGWTGGLSGTGSRMNCSYTRAIDLLQPLKESWGCGNLSASCYLVPVPRLAKCPFWDFESGALGPILRGIMTSSNKSFAEFILYRFWSQGFVLLNSSGSTNYLKFYNPNTLRAT